jgi:lysophospholipase L1-like esterase
MRNITLRLLLSATILLLLTLLLEGGARLYLGDRFVPGLPTGLPLKACGSYDPDLGWVNKPGVKTRVVAARFAYNVEINSKGMRDREHEYEPENGVFRIALLGDSLAWGWGVENGECFADLLEERLSPGVEVINLAVPGYGTDQELWMLNREGWKYHPDLVVLCMILNDLETINTTWTSGMQKPCFTREVQKGWVLKNHPVPAPAGKRTSQPKVGFLTWLNAHSAFMKLLQPDEHPQTTATGEGRFERLVRQEEKYNKVIATLCDDLVDPGSLIHMLLKNMQKACQERGVPLLVFSIAHHHDRFIYEPGYMIPPDIEASLKKGGGPYKTVLSRRLEEAGRMIGIETFSVDQAMLEETGKGAPLHVGDGHLNRRGNEVVADVMESILKPFINK